VVRLGLLAGHDLVDGGGAAGRGERGGEPLVDLGPESVLAAVDVGRVADLVGEGIRGRKPAPVVGRRVDPLPLFTAVAAPQNSELVNA